MQYAVDNRNYCHFICSYIDNHRNSIEKKESYKDIM